MFPRSYFFGAQNPGNHHDDHPVDAMQRNYLNLLHKMFIMHIFEILFYAIN